MGSRRAHDLGTPHVIDPRDRYENLAPAWRTAVVSGACIAVWAIAAATLPRGLPTGIILLGAAYGGLYGLVAVGLVLVYRASRIVNFAQAELGALAGVLAVYLVVGRGWSYVVAVPLGLGVGAATGALVEVVVLRRFRRAPRLIATVATIGLAQILNGLSVLVAVLVSGGLTTGRFQTPFSVRFTVDPVVFVGDHVVVGVVVIGIVAALVTFLRRTDYGIALRAAADSGDRARLLGIPVTRLSTLVWTLAGLLSATGIILRVPLTGFQSFTAISGGGTSLLLRALAAAVIARMDRLGIALIAGLALGAVEGAAAWSYGNTAYADGILVLVILAALLIQRADFSRVAEGLQATAAYQAIREVRPIPSELSTLREVRGAALGLRLMVIVAATTFPLWAAPSRIELLSLVLIYALVAVSLVLLTGWAGHISLGHWAIAGIGGTTMATLFGRHELDLLVAAAGGIAVSALVAVLIGLPALRVRGPFLAVTTLAFGVTASTLLLNSRYVPWLVGDRISRPAMLGRFSLAAEWQTYYLVLVVLVLIFAAVGSLRRSRTGRALIALRDNAPNAAAFGVPAVRIQLVGFAISGALAGLAGVLYALHQGGIHQDAFEATVGLQVFSMVVIGGLGSVAGAVLGAGFIRGAQYFLSPGLALVASGGGILLLLLVAPGGLGEVLYRTRDRVLRTVATRRGIVVPSLLADSQTLADVPRGHDTLPEPSSRNDLLLSVRGLDAGYDGVQVLFGVDLDVIEGEILALLGTNGAGKSTILRAISGLSTPTAGTITFDGTDLTTTGAGTTVSAGIVTLPGGRGVFPSLRVADHFRIGGWSQRHDPEHIRDATQRALSTFPILRDRWEQPAGTLSGGEQQMLNLSMALLARPRLLLIDELSLGLAPLVVEQLIAMVKDIHATGTTVVIVEQSLTTALRLAERAVFLEKGEVRFTGPTAELLDRPDLLRAVFLGGAITPREPATVHRQNGQPAHARRGREILVAEGREERGAVSLAVESVSKRYGGITAIRNVTLEVEEAEILGIIGPNGAGKTTLFDLMSGFVRPDSGEVLLHGGDVSTWSASRRAQHGLGRSFQDARLWPSLTVAEAIAVARERHIEVRSALPAFFGLPVVAESEAAVTASVEDLIEVLRLHAFRDKFVSELSTGSRRVVEIAAVLAHEPSVVLLDEPSSGVAQREAEALGPMLRDVRERLGCAIVIIEHDLPLVLGLVDRLAVLDQGSLLRVGTPHEVMADPAVVAAYMGDAVAEFEAATQ